MLRFILASLVTCFAASPAAWAGEPQDPQVVVSGANPKQVHRAVVAAAEKLCREAIRHDIFADYGSQEECVAMTVHNAETGRKNLVHLADR
jgi:hypothetical protein